MRILKYIFLLLLLALFATAVFIATQKGNYDVSRSAIIKSPKATVYSYVNDLRNWETFGSWKKDEPSMQFYYPGNTIGNGGFYSWKGSDGEGDLKTITTIENQSINQKMNYNGSHSEVFWTFIDTLGATKVTWRSKGTMSFGFKIYSAFQGGVDNVIGTMYEKSLANLDKTLVYELKTYNIKVNGIIQKLGCYYMKQTITSKISNVNKNLRIMIPNIIHFFEKNKLTMYGKPFVMYHTYDVAKGLTRFSVAIPIKDQVFISEGSDITSGQLFPFQAVKTTLTGDYSHSKEAWDKTFEYIDKNKLTQKSDGVYLEIYAKNSDQIANPSQWVTEIYIPIQPKIATPVYKPKPVTTNTVDVQPVVTPVETKPEEVSPTP